jgi:acyl-CoA reductase-like NAD-dependent aldehyde dehydrogenase
VNAAKTAFKKWRRVPPLECAKMLKESLASSRERRRACHDRRGRLRQSNRGDDHGGTITAAEVKFFARLVTEMKHQSTLHDASKRAGLVTYRSPSIISPPMGFKCCSSFQITGC